MLPWRSAGLANALVARKFVDELARGARVLKPSGEPLFAPLRAALAWRAC
jgi:hypothetical protein